MDARAALSNKGRVFPGLRENETFIARTIISNAIYWKAIAICVLAIIFLLFAYQLTLFLLLVALIALVFAHLRKIFLLLIVTDERVLVRSGLLMVDTIQLQYNKIESVELQTTPMGQMLGYSTLMVSGVGSRLAFIPFVANAISLQASINEILQRRDVSSGEHMELQARVQAEALADVLDEKNRL